MLISNSVSSSVVATKSDTTSVDCDMIYVGGTGHLAIKHSTGSSAVLYSAIPAGTILPLKLKDGRIMSTDTTATLIVAMKL